MGVGEVPERKLRHKIIHRVCGTAFACMHHEPWQVRAGRGRVRGVRCLRATGGRWQVAGGMPQA